MKALKHGHGAEKVLGRTRECGEVPGGCQGGRGGGGGDLESSLFNVTLTVNAEGKAKMRTRHTAQLLFYGRLPLTLCLSFTVINTVSVWLRSATAVMSNDTHGNRMTRNEKGFKSFTCFISRLWGYMAGHDLNPNRGVKRRSHTACVSLCDIF